MSAFEHLHGLGGVHPVGSSLPCLGARSDLRQPQLQVVGRSRGPLLQKGHLHAGRAVDPVGSLHQGDEHDRPEFRVEVLPLDLLADGVDPGAVLRLQVAALLTEDLREVAGRRR